MKRPICGFPILFLAPVLWGASMSPDDAVQHAVRHQPDLAAARLLVVEARARRVQAGVPANPEFETEIRPNTQGGEGVIAFRLTQRFPMAARLRKARAVSEGEIAAADAELADAERQVARRTAYAVAAWLGVMARMELAGRQITNAQAFAAAFRTAAERGEGSSTDARQLDLEAGQWVLRRRQLEQERAVLRGELRGMLGLSVEEPLELAGALPDTRVWQPALPLLEVQTRPEVRIAEARLETARREIRLARAQRWQDMGLGVVSELQRAEDRPDGIQRDDFVGVYWSIPLPFWNRNQGRIREVETVVERRRLELEAVELRVRNEQRSAAEALELAVAAEREWREQQLPLARELEVRMQRQNEQGQSGFVEWSRVRERRLQAEGGHLEAQQNLLRAWIDALVALGEFPKFPPHP